MVEKTDCVFLPKKGCVAPEGIKQRPLCGFSSGHAVAKNQRKTNEPQKIAEQTKQARLRVIRSMSRGSFNIGLCRRRADEA